MQPAKQQFNKYKQAKMFLVKIDKEKKGESDMVRSFLVWKSC